MTIGNGDGEHRTVSRVVRILEMVATASGPVRLTTIAVGLDAPKTSAYGLVKGLVATGYLREEGTGYRMGPAVGSLLTGGQNTIAEIVRPTLEQLRATFDETAILSARVGSSVVYLDTAESSRLIRYAAPVRQRRPLHPTSTGKCFLAQMDPSRRRAFLETLVSDPAVRATALDELVRVRAEGVAYNRGETVPDVSAAASIVRAPPSGAVALAVVGPTHRVAPQFTEIAEAVRTAAAAAEEALAREA